tara:strand:- start:388 stop:609 length:222 start_codon:yes stop_codon:yes gene_type:complete
MASASAGSPAATRKTLFSKDTDAAPATEEKVSENDKAIVEETLAALREEVKELAKTSWMYEGNDPDIASRVKI